MLVMTTMWLAACSGGASSDSEADPGADPNVKREIQCPEGRTFGSARTAKGEEQFCSRNGMLDGPYFRRHPNGNKAEKGTYADNVQDGDWWWWYENGQEQRKGKYSKGRKIGPWTEWYDNGNRLEEGDYLQNRKQGQWVTWYEDGLKKEEGLYHNDGKNGDWTYYNDDPPDNTVAKTERWENGAVVESKGTDPVAKPPKGTASTP
jgi:antitoxin component YwqK of YwqJK toxin-antitoxin module